ncbi:RVP_2 domain-containing protein [Gossypium australe]|uniref:RVP_2 domain-containing protein n=1 Tax=Gossypium australe TaxID=47621 RepID=A0A5B6VYM4_9ROSI|nr:RVP_2 domain-containing protein [Gossypium australe]
MSCRKKEDSEALDIITELSLAKVSKIVTNPSGQSIVVNRVVKDCSLSFDRQVFLADLMLLSFHEFDTILRLDWLTRHNVIFECKSKRLWLISTDGNKAIRCKSKEMWLISEKMITNGGDTYLVYILNSKMVREDFEQVPMVNEFEDVFPEELSEILLN